MYASSPSIAASATFRQQRNVSMLENAGGTVRESDTRHHVRDIQQDLALIGAVHNTHSDEGREELQSGLEARGGNGANNLHRNTAASTIHDLRRHPDRSAQEAGRGFFLTGDPIRSNDETLSVLANAISVEEGTKEPSIQDACRELPKQPPAA